MLRIFKIVALNETINIKFKRCSATNKEQRAQNIAVFVAFMVMIATFVLFL
jgi:hypothetical protein